MPGVLASSVIFVVGATWYRFREATVTVPYRISVDVAFSLCSAGHRFDSLPSVLFYSCVLASSVIFLVGATFLLSGTVFARLWSWFPAVAQLV